MSSVGVWEGKCKEGESPALLQEGGPSRSESDGEQEETETVGQTQHLRPGQQHAVRKKEKVGGRGQSAALGTQQRKHKTWTARDRVLTSALPGDRSPLGVLTK